MSIMTAIPAPPVPSVPLLRPVDPLVADAGLSVEELGSRIVGLAGRIAAATGRWLGLVADFDAREGFARFGLSSTARWLSHACGISHRTAVEHVRVARAMVAFPVLAQGTMVRGLRTVEDVDNPPGEPLSAGGGVAVVVREPDPAGGARCRGQCARSGPVPAGGERANVPGVAGR